VVGDNSLVTLSAINLKRDLLSLKNIRFNSDVLGSRHVDSFFEPIILECLGCRDSTEILDISGLGLSVQALEVVVLASGLAEFEIGGSSSNSWNFLFLGHTILSGSTHDNVSILSGIFV